MSTGTLPRWRAPVERGGPVAPPKSAQKVGTLPAALGARMGLAPKTAEKRLAAALEVLHHLCDAGVDCGLEQEVREKLVVFDARRVVGVPLPYSEALAVAVSRVDSNQNQLLLEFVAEGSQENRERLTKALKRDILENQELLVSLEYSP